MQQVNSNTCSQRISHKLFFALLKVDEKGYFSTLVVAPLVFSRSSRCSSVNGILLFLTAFMSNLA